MARTINRGLEYYPINTNLFSDIKVRKLIKYQGGKSISIYVYLLCNIYQNGYYIQWDDELPFLVSEPTGLDVAYVSEVIKCCLNVGLFSKEMFESERILTSKGIQERYDFICKQSRKKSSVVEYSLINVTLMNNNATVKTNNDSFSTQRKVKESKVKSNTDVLPKSDNDIEIDDVPDFVKTERERALLASEEQKKEIRGAAALENFDWQGWFFQSSQDKLFLEAPCMRHKISSGECVKYLQEFVYERAGIGDSPRSLSDLRKHFYAWIVKRIQGEKQNSINEKGKLTTALENVDGAVDRLAETIQKQINGGWYDDY